MTKKSVFEFPSYKDYLQALADSRGKKGGMKSELAQVMGSHPAYLSRILAGLAELSIEQAEKIASHVAMDADEKRYFLFLLQEERAGTESLRKFFREERIAIQQRRMNIKDRIQPSKQISPEEQAMYYGAWYHSAIHVLVSIPKFQDLESIARYLDLSVATVRESLQFLEKIGVLKNQKGRWVIGDRHLHLESSSPLIRLHHTNWRLKSVDSLDRKNEEDLRYSAVFTMTEADAQKVKEAMLKHLKEYLSVIGESKEERAYAYSFDFFELGRS